MSDSVKYGYIHNFFVYEAISTFDSSKCLYLRVLKTYTNRIELLMENGISTSRWTYDTSTTFVIYIQRDPFYSKIECWICKDLDQVYTIILEANFLK